MKYPSSRLIAAVCILLLSVAASVILAYSLYSRLTSDGNADTSQASDAVSKAVDEISEEPKTQHVPETQDPLDTPSAAMESEIPFQSFIPVQVQELNAERISNRDIRLTWPDTDDELVATYLVRRKTVSDGISDWETVASVTSDGMFSGEDNTYTDRLHSAEPQQFAYRIDVEPVDRARYAGETGRMTLAGNLLICIDPGHYAGCSKLAGEKNYGYTEGDFTLQIGLKLKQILKEQYGIDSCLTRETGTIQLSGYTDSELDNYHISLRGEYAQGSDFFVSLHTNANEDNANGYPTCNQPISINKTLVIVNQPAVQSDTSIKVANAVGKKLSEVSYQQGLSSISNFSAVYESADIVEWTEEFNDSINTPGTVCQRRGEHGDYYGVLRGAANVGVPGAIIEHGMHTVAEVRQAAMEGNLADLWATADASGIAEGFAFLAIADIEQ